jgi:hypothetical protein
MDGFKEATKEVNDETLALLEKYPDLMKIEGILSGEKGTYRLDQTKLNEYLI